ncbi:hypothetical protein [Neorhodopirellula lusitana]|uniref:hypothetical protein n=1 Tax=Neorhodopirellula lusitana TaxID=445327 RepID=UPI00384DAA86
MPLNVWQEYAVGDPVEVVHIPSDTSTYHWLGNLASDGNLIFDIVLVAIEFLMMAGAVARGIVAIIRDEQNADLSPTLRRAFLI